ncbi:hypothetical protein BH160DRAFT_6039, partial [Burkholderia sp. H160]
DHKVISAQSGERVTAAHPAGQCRGKTLQQFVSYRMSVGVVYFLETVQVYKKQGGLMDFATACDQRPTNLQGYAIGRPQDPSAILAASSSASFVTDPAVASFIEALIATENETEGERELDAQEGAVRAVQIH